MLGCRHAPRYLRKKIRARLSACSEISAKKRSALGRRPVAHQRVRQPGHVDFLSVLGGHDAVLGARFDEVLADLMHVGAALGVVERVWRDTGRVVHIGPSDGSALLRSMPTAHAEGAGTDPRAAIGEPSTRRIAGYHPPDRRQAPRRSPSACSEMITIKKGMRARWD